MHGIPGTTRVLREGMALAIEPLLVLGSPDTRLLDDDWTVVSQDGGWSAHFEHTVAITADGPWVLTASAPPPAGVLAGAGVLVGAGASAGARVSARAGAAPGEEVAPDAQ